MAQADLTSPRVKVALQNENERPWHEVEQEFLECEYRAVRDRQMQELEMEDDIMSKVPIRCILFSSCCVEVELTIAIMH